MIKRADLTPLEAAEQLAALSPQTRARFQQWKACSGPDERRQPYAAFQVIGEAIASKRNAPSPAQMKSLFAFAERLLQERDGDVANMVATSMLEALWAAARGSGFDFRIVDPHLGPVARGYLVAWDAFNKTQTPGLTGC